MNSLSNHSSNVIAHSVRQVSNQWQVQLPQLVVLLPHEWQIEEAVRWTLSVRSHPRVFGISIRGIHVGRVLSMCAVALCRFAGGRGGKVKLNGHFGASRPCASGMDIGQHQALQIRTKTKTLADETLK
jgi:hypothetical protein